MKNKNLHYIKSSGFKVPKDYFNNLENKIFESINLNDELISTKESGFTVPQGYFNDLTNRIENKIAKEKQVRVISLFRNKKVISAVSIAAAVIILFGLLIFNQKPTFDNLQNETVENYIIEEDISSYEVATLLTEDQLNNDIYIESDIENENIETYLLETVEIEDLLIE